MCMCVYVCGCVCLLFFLFLLCLFVLFCVVCLFANSFVCVIVCLSVCAAPTAEVLAAIVVVNHMEVGNNVRYITDCGAAIAGIRRYGAGRGLRGNKSLGWIMEAG